MARSFSFMYGMWPLILLYLGFYQLCPYLKPYTGGYVASIVSNTVPAVILMITMGLHALTRRALPLFVAVMGNALWGSYNIWNLYLEISSKIPKQLTPKLVAFLNNVNFVLIFFYVLPLIVAVFGARYLWSHTNRLTIFKQGVKKLETHGTAEFANLALINHLNKLDGLPIGAVPNYFNLAHPQQVIRSIKQKAGKQLIRLRSDHTTVIAPSGAGKGVGVVIPTLLEYPGPLFVTDIKGENYTITRRAREAMKRQVIAFDPFDITCSKKVCINPLDFLDPNCKEIVDNTATLANLICPTSPQDGSNAGYFQAQGAAVIQCLLLHVICSEKIKDDERHLAKVYDLLCTKEEDLIKLLTEIGQDSELGYGAASRIANRIVGTDPRERSGILNSACVEMRFIDTPHVRESTSSSDVFLSDITDGNIDLFVCIPPSKLETQSRLLRLLTGIVFLEMQKAMGRIGPYPLLMVIDEMPALGYMKQIEQVLTYGRGYGVSLMAISQTIELIKGVYPKSWETFFSNQLSLFFACNDPMTCEFVSKMIGKTTVETNSSNRGLGKQTRSMELFGSSSMQSGDSVSETGRPLLMPEDIKALGDRVLIAFVRGEPPILCQRIDYRDRKEWNQAWDENPLHKNRVEN